MKKIIICLTIYLLSCYVYAYDTIKISVDKIDSSGVNITADSSAENIKSHIKSDDFIGIKKIIIQNKADKKIKVKFYNDVDGTPINRTVLSGTVVEDILKKIVARQQDFFLGHKATIVLYTESEKIDSIILNTATKPKLAEKKYVDSVVTGIPYYDALALSKYNVETDMDKLNKISKFLLRYSDADTAARFKWTDIRTLYKSNRFMSDFINSIDTTSLHKNKQINNEKDFSCSYVTKAISSVGGLNVTGLADGMAKFLVKRVKQEMATAFFKKFSNGILDDKYKDMRTLFPATYLCLSAISDRIYNYDAYIQSLRESFEKDLKAMLDNIPYVIKSHNEIKSADRLLLNSGLYFARSLNKGKNAGRVIRDFPIEEKDSLNNIYGVIQALKIISESIRDTAQSPDSSYWVSPDRLRTLMADSTAFKIYLGLVYQQACGKNIKTSGATLRMVLDSAYSRIDKVKEYIGDFSDAADNLSSIINTYGKISNDSDMIKYFNYYINSSVELIRAASGMTAIVNVNGKHSEAFASVDSAFLRLEKTTRITGNITGDLKRKNYSSAIVNAALLYESCIPKASDTSKFVVKLLKYGTFMATLAQASNSDEIEKTIEAFALPSGSASLKRNALVDVSLNAYTGLFWGWEKEIAEGTADVMHEIGGINAPIGIALSTSKLNMSWLYIQSKTLFISIIDIGAVTAYRFKNDSVDNLPELKFENIIAPGVHIVFGLKDLPVSIGGGVQYGPSLRSVSDSAATINTVHGYRWNIFAAVDIPLWNIYSSQKDE
jgi:hypothetical protein